MDAEITPRGAHMSISDQALLASFVSGRPTCLAHGATTSALDGVLGIFSHEGGGPHGLRELQRSAHRSWLLRALRPGQPPTYAASFVLRGYGLGNRTLAEWAKYRRRPHELGLTLVPGASGLHRPCNGGGDEGTVEIGALLSEVPTNHPRRDGVTG